MTKRDFFELRCGVVRCFFRVMLCCVVSYTVVVHLGTLRGRVVLCNGELCSAMVCYAMLR